MHALKSVHSSFVRWGLVSALALWAAVAASRTPSAGDSAALERSPAAVLIGSSSFSQDFGHLIERELTRRGYQVTRKGVPGAGLARPDFHDMVLEAEALPIDAETAAVFVYIGVNDAQALWLRSDERSDPESTWLPFASEGWNTVYTRRVRAFLERMCQRGAQRAIVLLPVDVDRPELQERLLHIRELQVQAAAATTCAVAVQTAGDAGQFELAGERKRLPDGFHMTALGARAIWERIEPEVLHLLYTEPTANARSLD
jgi:hypothetical protein